MILEGSLGLLNCLGVLLLIQETVELAKLVRHVVREHEKLLQTATDLYPLLVVVRQRALELKCHKCINYKQKRICRGGKMRTSRSEVS